MSMQPEVLANQLKADAGQFQILVVEDDRTFRKLIVRTLERIGYKVREAQNGKVAVSILELNVDAFHLILSDVKMPEMDGVALLTYVKGRSSTPFIMMTGFAEILEVMDAHSLGADEFLPKPFATEALYQAIFYCLHPEQRPKAGDTETTSPQAKDQFPVQEYCQIHIDEFISSTHLLSDIYVKLSENKYVKVAHKGEAIPVDRLRTYQEKKVNYLYVTVEDFSSYVDFNIKITQLANDKIKLPKEKKTKLFTRTTELIVERCFIGEIDKNLLAPAQQMVEDTLKMVSGNNDLLSLLDNLSSNSNRLYAHSVAVSFFGCLLAKQRGWVSTSTTFKVSLGGMLHDVGLKEINPAIVEKARADLTYEEVMQFETHPLRGREILFGIRGLPEEISLIAQHHHESPNGTGYPLRLKGEEIHPLANLLKVADMFCELTLPISTNEQAFSPEAAFRCLAEAHSADLDPKDLDALRSLLKVPKSRAA